MKEIDHIQNLISMSHNIGKKIEYVQGGGGNTSVKVNDNFMYIKASGVSLKDMSINFGTAKVDYQKVNNYHDSPDESEDSYNNTINNFSLTPGSRPSIETGFHAILGKYVIHSHSIFINIFLCSDQGKKILLELFPESLWVDYCTPGRELTLKIKETLSVLDNNFQGLIFLQNHGVISSASNYKDCLKIHSDCNKIIKDHFKLEDFRMLERDATNLPKNFLFPDQVIYLSDEQADSKTQAFLETISTVRYLESTINQLSLTPRYLAESDVEILNNMQSEEYRKKISK